MHRAGDEHAARGVHDAHEHGIGARELGGDARQQRERAGVVALARGRGRLVERRELRREAARADGRMRGLERAAGDLGDAVGQREILRRQRLAGVAPAEDDGDARALGVAQREAEHRGGAAVALERDVGGLARDRGALVGQRAPGEAAVGAQVPALHPAGAAARAGGDHEAPVRLAHGDGGPVAGEALGGRAADRIEHAVEVERDAGEQAGGRAHAVGDRGAAPQRGAMGRVELGRGRGADALEHAARRAEQGLHGLGRRAGDLRPELDERPLQRADERDEAETALDAAGDLALEHERRERRAVGVAQRALERLERLLAARAHARERDALGREHLVRHERAALEQRRAQLGQQREAGRLGLGSLVDHGAQHRAVRRPASARDRWTTLRPVSVPPGRRTRWKDRADDPELERELIEELDRRRRARAEDRQRRAQERRSRWVIWLFVLLTAGAAVAIGYGALSVARSLFG